MTAKEYLQQLKGINVAIDQKTQELNRLRAMAESIGGTDYSKERVQTSPSNEAPYVKAVNQLVDVEKEVEREMAILFDKKHKIINQIQGLQNPIYVQVLYKRYEEGKELKEISDELNYTYQYILNMHMYALKDFKTTYKKL